MDRPISEIIPEVIMEYNLKDSEQNQSSGDQPVQSPHQIQVKPDQQEYTQKMLFT